MPISLISLPPEVVRLMPDLPACRQTTFSSHLRLDWSELRSLAHLGDGLLNDAVAFIIDDIYPNLTPHQRTVTRSSLVNNRFLSHLCRHLPITAQLASRCRAFSAGAHIVEGYIGGMYRDYRARGLSIYQAREKVVRDVVVPIWEPLARWVLGAAPIMASRGADEVEEEDGREWDEDDVESALSGSSEEGTQPSGNKEEDSSWGCAECRDQDEDVGGLCVCGRIWEARL
ncbi:hypothetical protein BCR39DRAFT_556555 [Naematelia encephala]|uniref:RNase III domain-containing protein n=1 Tax=Naematelia encephala TaxID=71784 RepID=A0A1Y2BLP5_9TREE|nr:hypothetical protein BCR39DRAFT_556555 [Naematelia encephala]